MSNEPTDQILESMLQETLGGKSPPDLSERIFAAWQREKVTGERQEALVPADQAASLPANKRPIVAELVRPAPPKAKVNEVKRVRRVARTSPNWRVLLATSAAVALLLAGWALKDQFLGTGQIEQAVASQEEDLKQSNDGVAPPETSSNTDVGTHLAADAIETQYDPNSSTAIPLDDLPFAPANSGDPSISATASNIEVTSPLSGPEIVTAINSRLTDMWQQSGVQPTQPLAQSQWLRKASQRLIATDEVDLGAAVGSRDAAIAKLVSSPRFAKQWAVRWTDAWLAQSSGATNEETITTIQGAIEKRIQDGTEFAGIAVDLLGGDLAVAGPTQAFVGSLAGGGNHNLLRRVGSHFLGTNLGCVQCHDRNVETSVSLAANALDQQSGYWSLIAMLRGVDVKVDSSGRRQPIDRQAELFGEKRQHNEFFELPDGRMKATIARLPDGNQWQTGNETPRVALARWIAQSQEFDAAIANQVWEFVTGEVLIHDASYPDMAALESRRELLQLLSQQFRANGRSLQKLASWIVSSEAFDRQPLSLSSDQLIVASEAQLEQLKLTQRLFAAGLASERPNSVERNIGLAANFRRPSMGDEVTLAQPNITAPPKNPGKTRQKKQPTADELAFTLGADHISFANANFVDNLLKSHRLTWDQRVQHIVSLNSHARVSGQVRQLANRLLQHHNGDSRAALLDLLWAVERSL